VQGERMPDLDQRFFGRSRRPPILWRGGGHLLSRRACGPLGGTDGDARKRCRPRRLNDWAGSFTLPGPGK
jgi:hypothetical protein